MIVFSYNVLLTVTLLNQTALRICIFFFRLSYIIMIFSSLVQNIYRGGDIE